MMDGETGATPLVVVVYQFGKVASTSIVAWFDAQDNVSAFQSHYLGATAYRRILEQTLDPAMSDYFFRHQLGQLSANITISRRMSRIEQDFEPGRVALISLSRDHMEWVRSAVVQDVTGYLDMFEMLAARDNPGHTLGPRGKVRAGLLAMMNRLLDQIDACGGGEAFLDRITNRQLADFAKSDFWTLPSGPQFFFAFVRPLLWFDGQFVDATGLSLEDFSATDGFWKAGTGARTHHILRYEDIGTVLPRIAADLGCPEGPPLPDRNVSAKKPFAEDVKEVFSGPEAARLRAHFAGTRYMRFFGYDAA